MNKSTHILMSKPSVLEALDVSEGTLKRWITAGKFPRPIRLQADGVLRWRLSDVEAFVDKRARQRLKRSPRGFQKGGATK